MQPTHHQLDRQVIFIDASLPDYQTLIDGLSETTDVVKVAPDQDGFQVMAEWAQTHSGYRAMHIVGHGSEGAQQLGNATLSHETLATYQAELSQIGKALTEGGDILLYGCHVAANQAGVDFIGKLSQATSADIAASDDLTGSQKLGGNWILEKEIGQIEYSDKSNAVISQLKEIPLLLSPAVGTIDFGSTNYWTSETPAADPSKTNILGSGLDLIVDNNGATQTDIEIKPVGGISSSASDMALALDDGAYDKIQFKSTDGGAFKVTSMVIKLTSGSAQELNFTAYKNNTEISGSSFSQTFNSNSTASVDFSSQTGFTNLDEIRITPTNPSALMNLYFDDIVIAAAEVSNNTPTITLPSSPSVSEDATSVAIADDIQIADDDAGDTQTVTLTIGGGTASLVTTTGLTGLTGNGTASISFSGSLTDVNNALDALTFTPTADLSGTNAGSIQIQTDDGNSGTDDETITFDITAVNDAPTITSSGNYTLTAVNEETPSTGVLVSAILADGNINGADVDSGASSGIAVTATTGTGSWEFSTDNTNWTSFGSVSTSAALLLDSATYVRFTGGTEYSGSANFTFQAWDQTSGSASTNGSAQTGNASVNGTSTAFSTNSATTSITVNAVDDAPTGSGAATPASFTEDTQGNLDLSGFTVADVDSASVTITLTASAGTLVASSSGGVTVGGSTTDTLTLTGAPGAINTWLDTTSNVQYTGATNASGTGAATITITGADGTTSNVAMGSVTVNITAVDDAPTVSAVPDDSVVLSVGQYLDLAASSVADVDSSVVTAVISVDSGTLTATSAGGNHSGGAAVVQADSQTVAVSGSPTQVNAYLNDTSELTFTSAASTTDVTLTVSVSDGMKAAEDTATISVLDVARPTASNYTDSTNEDTAVTAFSNTELPTTEDTDTGTAHTVEYITIDTSTVTGGVLSLTGTPAGGTSTTGGITFDTATGNLSGTVNIAIGDIGKLVFTPTAELSGTGAGSFAWTVTDSGGDTSTAATWTLDITAVEDVPTLTGVTTTITALEDTATNLITGTPVFADVDTTGDIVATLTATNSSATLTASDASGVEVGNSGTHAITLTGTAAEINTFLQTASNVTYKGVANSTTSDTVTITVDDSEGGTGTAETVTVNFTPVNDAPVIGSLNGDSTQVSINASEYIDDNNVSVTDVDGDESTLNYNGGYVLIERTSGIADGSFLSDADEVDPLDVYIKFGTTEGGADSTPAADDSVWWFDGANFVSIGTVDTTKTGQSGADLRIDFDTDNASALAAEEFIKFLKFSAPTEGDRVFSVTVNDGTDTSTAASFTMTVIDDTKPVATSYTDSGNEDTSVSLTATELPTTQDSQDTPDALEYLTIDTSTVVGGVLSLDSTGTTGTSTVGGISYGTTAGNLTGTVHINIADISKLDFTPTANLAGTGAASFSWTVTDAGGHTSPEATYTLNLTNTSDAPEGTDKTVSINTSQTHTFSASDFGFTDVDTGDSLNRVQVNVQTIDNGALKLNDHAVSDGDWIDLADLGNLVYTPNAAGSDTFTFTVEDNSISHSTDATPNTITLNVTTPSTGGGGGTVTPPPTDPTETVTEETTETVTEETTETVTEETTDTVTDEATETVTEETTETVTEETTDTVTDEATETVTEETTETVTDEATETVTEETTDTVTDEATETVTEETTETVTDEATETVTEETTDTVTDEPTETVTEETTETVTEEPSLVDGVPVSLISTTDEQGQPSTQMYLDPVLADRDDTNQQSAQADIPLHFVSPTAGQSSPQMVTYISLPVGVG
ncbi:protein of unknown function, partial [Allopseudospirillum japonicum]